MSFFQKFLYYQRKEFVDYYKENDLVLFKSIDTIFKMNGVRASTFVDDILCFIKHRKIKDPFETYLKRVGELQKLQKEFQKTGAWTTPTPIDIETYNLSLLLSFIACNHRYEVLLELEMLLISETKRPLSVMSVGFGSGYELKLVYDQIKELSTFDAFDTSRKTVDYARDLLTFFNYPIDCLKFGDCRSSTQPYDVVLLISCLEHMEKSREVLRDLKCSLASGGKLFLTIAVNIAQEDHIQHYKSFTEARNQVLDAGLEIIREKFSPVTIFTFKEEDRMKFDRGLYICVAR